MGGDAIYLEIPSLFSFFSELKEKKIKEVRFVQAFQQIPMQPIALVSKQIIFTAIINNDIIIHKEIIGEAPIVAKDQIDELNRKAEEFMAKNLEKFHGIKLKEGIYKYPSEVGT